MSLVYVDSDPWLTEHEACEKLFREIMEQLTIRSREQKTSQAYARLSSAIRLRMRQYSNEVDQLKDKLGQASYTHSLTFQEAERRSRQVELLQSRDIQLQKSFNDRDIASEMNRSRLLHQSGPVFADMGTTGWGTGDEEIDQAQYMSVPELRQQQLRMVEDQDQGLEALSKVISRQKEIANTIGVEVDLQNEIIDDLAEHIDRTDSRVINETRQIRIIDRKDNTCWFWVIIIILFIAIVITAIV